MNEIINSEKNSNIKLLRSLKTSKGRDRHKKFIMEGERLIQDALDKDVEIDFLIISKNREKKYEDMKIRKKIVEDKLFKSISDTVNTQGIMAIANKKTVQEPENLGETVLFLDEVNDPGNLGTIIRSAAAFDVKNIYLSSNSCDVYNEKTIRASMGAIFNVNFFYTSYEKLKELNNKGYYILGASLDGEIYDNKVYYDKKVVLLMGNEAKGISDKALEAADFKIKIAMSNKVESLNLSAATTILLYERYKVRKKI